MFSKEKISKLLTGSLKDGASSALQLAKSAAVGVYVAFSPFPGVHIIMMFVLKFLFKLNLPILFLVTSINNPWTMIPFFALDYLFGYWFVHNVIGWSPTLQISLNNVFGLGDICVWSFIIGGNILGILFAFISYPFFKIIFLRLYNSKRDAI